MVTFQLGGEKALGPDGFNLLFYQTFWETIEDDIFNVFWDLYDDRFSTSAIDYSYICLVPKMEGARVVNDFRPISLLNGLQTIILKVLANPLEVMMASVISSTQSAFLKRQFILDSFVTVRELVGWCSKTGEKGIGVKVDFKKAYDRVNWLYLKQTKIWLGANSKWCRWVE